MIGKNTEKFIINQTTMKIYLKKKSGAMLFALTIGLFLSSCSKKSDSTSPSGSNKITSAKFTITVTGVDPSDGDVSDFDFSAYSPSATSSTYWKINGVTQTNQDGIALHAAGFVSQNTYIVELTQPANNIDAGITCVNSHAPFTVSYIAEINGTVVKTITNQSVAAGVNFTPTFAYP
jgi:hypothetical protein